MVSAWAHKFVNDTNPKPKDQSTWKLNKKRQSERALRAVTRRKEQEELGTGVKAYQRVYVRKTQVESIRADVDTSAITAEASVWSGPRDETLGKERSFEEAKALEHRHGPG